MVSRNSHISRFRHLVGPILLFLMISLATRVALLFRPDVRVDVLGTAGAFAVGFGYDLVTAAYLFAPVVLLLALLPATLLDKWPMRLLGAGLRGILIFSLLLVAIAEWIFWDEFGGRFNFIAVDYLIYTHEVLGNIWQSYPVGKILTALAILSLLATLAMWRRASRPTAGLTAKQRTAAITLALALPSAAALLIDTELKNVFASDALDELAGNGPYEFFAALRASDLDFNKLYWHLPPDDALTEARRLRSATRSGWRSDSPRDFLHRVEDPRPPKRLNVVLVSVESLGAEFLGSYGDDRRLTPRLDELARHSLVFSRVYATGNRTVRGLEALSLGLPPTPGQSIVKRPHNDQLFSLGSVFEDHGYASLFIYGGYGYFDNMNGFFAANDYTPIDRLSMPANRIHYENIWGVADEDLFDLALDEIDHAMTQDGQKRPVFAHIMTTSNHRPYTYPEGRIDIPSGSGREGAVKYTDWAIGHLIDEARQRPWFDDTLFVITADHGASARGTTEIPVEKYHIPLLIYAPRHLQPGRIDRVMSQIDIPPTLLGQLHFSYDSKFFGQDILTLPSGHERAFVANYQTLGYLRDGRLVTLGPRQKATIHQHPAAPPQGTPPLSDTELLREAAAWYGAAYLGFRHGYILDEDEVATPRGTGQ